MSDLKTVSLCARMLHVCRRTMAAARDCMLNVVKKVEHVVAYTPLQPVVARLVELLEAGRGQHSLDLRHRPVAASKVKKNPVLSPV